MSAAGHRWPLAAILLALLALHPAPARADDGPAVLDLPYTLSRPPGAGPFPAVVILHDCSGLGPRSGGGPARWSAELTARGYVTLWPDSFTGRGKANGVCIDNAEPRVDYPVRARDAHAALAHLRTLSFVDARRIAVMGASHGGASTLQTIVAGAPGSGDGGPDFAAAVALYPNCGRSMGGWTVTWTRDGVGKAVRLAYAGAFAPRAPLLILAGELDDWTPAEPCRHLAESAPGTGHPVQLVVYPGAHHAFDSNAPLRFNPERLNGYSPTGRGATTAGNAEAWADAVVRVTQFLATHLGTARAP